MRIISCHDPKKNCLNGVIIYRIPAIQGVDLNLRIQFPTIIDNFNISQYRRKIMKTVGSMRGSDDQKVGGRNRIACLACMDAGLLPGNTRI